MTSNKNIIIVILLLILLLQIFSKYNDITEYFSPIKVDPSNRQILILYTGGTIGMKETKTGNKPAKGF
jgi:L-asparaginase/Glu-tRNA(Gln) amidotransferase subunit D